jgi:pilus assembly protein Flp/PilA
LPGKPAVRRRQQKILLMAGVRLHRGSAMFSEFFVEEDGAQVVEYALIVAVLSIALVLAMDALTIGGSFASFIGRVATCLTTASCV